MLLLTPENQPDYGLKPLLHLATCDHPALLIILECYPECIPRDGLDIETEISTFTYIACSASSNWTCRALALDVLFASISRSYATDSPLLKAEPTMARLIQALGYSLFFRETAASQYATPLIYFNSALAISGLLLVLRPVEDIIKSHDFSSWLQTIQLASDDLSVRKMQRSRWMGISDVLY